MWMLMFKDAVFGIVVEGTFVKGTKEEVVLSPTHALSLIVAGEGCTDVLMVIAKLTDGKETHIPYRDSKLTRLLQSSFSGHGRISLICTVTLASSSSEETHNTLKFAHRSKHVEIKAFLNKIMDEKSLIKKYHKKISELKQELQQLKRGMVENPNMAKIVVPLGGIPVDTSELELKPQGKLALTIVKATALKYMEMIGKSDPNVVVHIQPLFKY
ncbi:hypothetical protein JHK86_022459 [Glycine max]|nr:hypothetical protein JHK86_022459 [Glycine max]